MNCGKYCACTQSKCDGCATCKELNIVRKELKKLKRESKQEYDELYRITEAYIKRLHVSEDENDNYLELLEESSRHLNKQKGESNPEAAERIMKEIEELRKLLEELSEACIIQNFPSDEEEFELLYRVAEALK